MESLYDLIQYVHIASGTLALAAFWTAGLARKGGTRHRRAGQAYLLAMLGVLVTGVPMAWHQVALGKPLVAAFLGYLLVITATGVWTAWRAIRDKHDVVRYTGPVFVALAMLSLFAGIATLALGLHAGIPLLVGFSLIGLYIGGDMLHRRWRRDRLAARPRWWLVEHYTAMLGNGIATHIAFLGLGLPRLFPAVDGVALHYAAWFGPLLTAVCAKVWLDRRWKADARRPSHAQTAHAKRATHGSRSQGARDFRQRDDGSPRPS